jgi:hypothetical protein
VIIRKENGGGLTLVTQTEHSRFVGRLAAHWGNARFAAPRPFESVVRAATYHDYGHLDWEPDPPFDAASGQPCEVRRLPDPDRQLAAHQRNIDWLTGIDPYSGLLVGMHATGLRRARYGTIEHPSGFNPPKQGATMESFLAKNESTQKAARAGLDEDAVWTNFHLLQVWDLLGLYFGCAEPGEDHIAPVPTGYAKAGERVTLRMKPDGPGRIAFDPYPFDQRPLTVEFLCKRLPRAKFESEAAFREAFYKAPEERVAYQLV